MSRNIEREDGADLGVFFSVHFCSIFCGASSKHSTLFYFIYFILQFIFFVHRISINSIKQIDDCFQKRALLSIRFTILHIIQK